MTARRDTPKVVRCPRCGYDQRGVIASWTTSCPVGSTCAECGLDFEWGDLLSRRRLAPRWFVEASLPWWRLPVAGLQTLFMMIRPRRFWTAVRMAHAVRARGLATFAVLLAVIGYGAFALSQGWVVGRTVAMNKGSWRQTVFSGAYAAALPLALNPPNRYFLRQNWMGRLPLSPRELAQRYRSRVFRAREVRERLLGLAPGRARSGPEGAAIVGVFAMLPVVTTPLGLLALPVSRRRAKVRLAHVLRISIYSLAIAVAVAVYAVVRFTIAGFAQPLYTELWHAMVWGVPLLLVTWWTCAIGRYLRIGHAPGIALAITAIGMLLGPALLLAAWGAGARLELWP
ncbi:MAG: hypothetical protein GY715_04430 [Planctomycetes bacterium]|nr:hypothetical protein [Planctomycetota bacterium]